MQLSFSFVYLIMVIYHCYFARSDTERLQSLTEKQAKQIEEDKLYIEVLEDREKLLAENVTICFHHKLNDPLLTFLIHVLFHADSFFFLISL